MHGEDPPRIVDLGRYRKALRAKAAHAPKASARTPILGSRRGAGLILALIIAVSIAWWLIPRLL
ncbi:MAG: hypothetical protein ABIO39_11985 [Caulobacteraceae bacterium]